ncbi:MAG: cytochrome c oxidase subunit II transmembrane domain-containing protein [Pseudomonadota bacterium]
MNRFLFTALAAAASIAFMGLEPGFAQEAVPDMPNPTGIGLRPAATPVAEEIHVFYDAILVPMKVGISLLILGLLLYVVFRFNKRANPVPKKFSHNTAIEIIWTALPVFILLIIAVPSFDLLFIEDKMPDTQTFDYEESRTTEFAFENDFPASRRAVRNRHVEVRAVDPAGDQRLLQAGDDYEVSGLGDEVVRVTLSQPLPSGERLQIAAGRTRVGKKPVLGLFGSDEATLVPAPTLTIKATGYQWGWAYSYPDYGDFEFDALIAPEGSVPAELYRLAATNAVVVPAGETVRVVTTGRDVIHSWAMPAFGIKIDAVPGRLNETWFYTEQENTYYGQCSEICGKDHAFMPIQLRVVSRDAFEAWVDERRALDGMEPLFVNNASDEADATQTALLK